MAIFESKLTNQYPTADPAMVFKGIWWKLIDPVFAGRLAYACLDLGITKFITNSAYRPTSVQEQLYQRFLAGDPKVPSAAKPGTSWHEFRLAVDTSTNPIHDMTDAQLRRYGLCKPLHNEPWHIQPIETLMQANRKKLEPVNWSAKVQKLFGLSDETMEYMDTYMFALTFYKKLMAGVRKFTNTTILFLQKYKYGDQLIKKLGVSK